MTLQRFLYSFMSSFFSCCFLSFEKYKRGKTRDHSFEKRFSSRIAFGSIYGVLVRGRLKTTIRSRSVIVVVWLIVIYERSGSCQFREEEREIDCDEIFHGMYNFS
jgi:hypothetical protein